MATYSGMALGAESALCAVVLLQDMKPVPEMLNYLKRQSSDKKYYF